jgi:hypothetical protein
MSFNPYNAKIGANQTSISSKGVTNLESQVPYKFDTDFKYDQLPQIKSMVQSERFKGDEESGNDTKMSNNEAFLAFLSKNDCDGEDEEE